MNLFVSLGAGNLRFFLRPSFSSLCSYRGGTRIRGARPKLTFVALNATSAMAHWRSFAGIAADFLLLTETRCTGPEQTIISNALKHFDWIPHWGPPVVVRPPGGMAGRSGGTAIVARSFWEKVDDLEVMCEAPRHHVQSHIFQNQFNKALCAVIVYYGHPEMKETTMRDLMRLHLAAEESELDIVVGGDINISDQDDFQRHQTQLQDTYHAGRAARRIDRLFLSRGLLPSLIDVFVDPTTYVPGHSAIGFTCEMRHSEYLVQVARPSLLRPLQAPVEGLQEQEAMASRKWNDLRPTLELDDMYRPWSGIWEAYLRYKYSIREPYTQTKGLVVKTRLRTSSPFKMKLSHWMRRLANYIADLRVLRAHHAAGRNVTKLWQRTVRSSKPIATRYGTPHLDMELAHQPEEVIQTVLKQTQQHYVKIWDAEIRMHRYDLRCKFKQKLATNSGVNKTVSRLLKGDEIKYPVIASDAGSEADPKKVTELVHNGWSAYFGKEPDEPSLQWAESTLKNVKKQTPDQLPLLCPRDLYKAIHQKNATTSPGPDSWHMRELQDLPLEATTGLTEILAEAEHQGRLPRDMVEGWMALVPKSKEASSPLAVRPISILSCVYRAYASLRASQLQPWAGVAYHEWQQAFIQGRSPRRHLSSLNLMLDEAKAGGVEKYVISMDASKAFPSINRRQAALLLREAGYPPQIIQIVESLYSEGQIRMRYAGSIVLEEPMKIRSGIHQGCPLSVLCFNMILAPLCEQLQKEAGVRFAVVFADDISVAVDSYDQLQLSLRIILDYLEGGWDKSQ